MIACGTCATPSPDSWGFAQAFVGHNCRRQRQSSYPRHGRKCLSVDPGLTPDQIAARWLGASRDDRYFRSHDGERVEAAGARGQVGAGAERLRRRRLARYDRQAEPRAVSDPVQRQTVRLARRRQCSEARLASTLMRESRHRRSAGRFHIARVSDRSSMQCRRPARQQRRLVAMLERRPRQLKRSPDEIEISINNLTEIGCTTSGSITSPQLTAFGRELLRSLE
jgi:hypothetical protein